MIDMTPTIAASTIFIIALVLIFTEEINRTITAIVILALGTPFAITLVKLAVYLNTLAQ